MDKIEVLRHSDLFYNLHADQLPLLADLASVQFAKANEQIFAEGSLGRELYVIARGSVAVSHGNHQADGADTEPVVLATLSHGQSFGAIAFIDQAAREATVTSLSDDTTLLVLEADALMAACEANPALGFFIIRNIAKDLALIIREMDVHMLGESDWGAAQASGAVALDNDL